MDCTQSPAKVATWADSAGTGREASAGSSRALPTRPSTCMQEARPRPLSWHPLLLAWVTTTFAIFGLARALGAGDEELLARAGSERTGKGLGNRPVCGFHRCRCSRDRRAFLRQAAQDGRNAFPFDPVAWLRDRKLVRPPRCPVRPRGCWEESDGGVWPAHHRNQSFDAQRLTLPGLGRQQAQEEPTFSASHSLTQLQFDAPLELAPECIPNTSGTTSPDIGSSTSWTAKR